MAEITEATWATYVDGERVELPATIDGIRAALPAQQRGEFDTEVGSTPANELPRVLGHWALRTHPQAWDEVEAEFARLEAGDYSGVVFLEDDHDVQEQGEGAA
ncbi:hypothetical protein [Streptomyces sp. NPDC127098]|uniref:hypothetical protein n=1 Tax=Streptomyces sp. NPDC127098 TaxID=3347137 RepID=UPI003661843B